MPSLTSADGQVLVPNVAVSKAFGRGNAKGLLGREGIAAGDGVLLGDPLGMIHMLFMKFAIDAVFMTSDLRVVKIAHELKPWRVARAGGARRILEIGAGEAERLGIRVGDQLTLVD
jgi:uncharacterized membrane protein (UPF0127 family)